MTRRSAPSQKKDLPTPTPPKVRAWELDFLRGFAIIMVVWDHLMYDSAYIFGYYWQASGNIGLSNYASFAQTYFTSGLRHFWWPFFVFIFFFVSGICTAFSKNNLIRGIKLALAAALVSIVTYITQFVLQLGEAFILFGVLHCLSSCILIYAVIELTVGLFNKKGNRRAMPIVCLAFAVAGIIIDSIYNVTLKEVVTNFASMPSDSKIAGLFVFHESWWTADYFPLLPFFWFFMLGSAIGHLFYKDKKSLFPRLSGKWHYPFTLPGRYSLIIYLASQVLTLAVLTLITWLATGGLPV